MTKLGLFGTTAVILSSALATPVMAQQVITSPGTAGAATPTGTTAGMTVGTTTGGTAIIRRRSAAIPMPDMTTATAAGTTTLTRAAGSSASPAPISAAKTA